MLYDKHSYPLQGPKFPCLSILSPAQKHCQQVPLLLINTKSNQLDCDNKSENDISSWIKNNNLMSYSANIILPGAFQAAAEVDVAPLIPKASKEQGAAPRHVLFFGSSHYAPHNPSD